MKCRICQKRLSYVNNVHLRTHGVTAEQYRERFPGVRLRSKEFCARQSISRSGEKHPMYGRHRSTKFRKMMSMRMSGKDNPFYGKSHTEKVKRLLSKTISSNDSPCRRPEAIAKACRAREKLFTDPEFVAKMVNNFGEYYNGRVTTKTEKKLSYVLRGLYPGEFRLNNRGQVMVILGMSPDFVNVNGKKKCIDIFAPHWKEVNCGSVANYKRNRTRKLHGVGWDVLYIEDKELKDIPMLKHKIAEFVNSKLLE